MKYKAFTLPELLIVIGIMLLLVAIAVPSLDALTGRRSLEAAENLISAVLARARQEGMLMQAGQGVIFYQDPLTDRIAMAMVYQPDPNGSPLRIDLLPDREPVLVQGGVELRFLNNAGQYVLPGVVWFDGMGYVRAQSYIIAANSMLGERIGLQQNVPSGADVPPESQVGFAMFERQALANVPSEDQHQWLEENALAILISRSSGALVRSE